MTDTENGDRIEYSCPLCGGTTEHRYSHTAEVRGTRKRVYVCTGCDVTRVPSEN